MHWVKRIPSLLVWHTFLSPVIKRMISEHVDLTNFSAIIWNRASGNWEVGDSLASEFSESTLSLIDTHSSTCESPHGLLKKYKILPVLDRASKPCNMKLSRIIAKIKKREWTICFLIMTFISIPVFKSCLPRCVHQVNTQFQQSQAISITLQMLYLTGKRVRLFSPCFSNPQAVNSTHFSPNFNMCLCGWMCERSSEQVNTRRQH